MTKTEISLFYAKISFTERVLISENAGMYVKMYENNKNNYRSKIIQNAKKTSYQRISIYIRDS
jgi:hypothetical protein